MTRVFWIFKLTIFVADNAAVFTTADDGGNLQLMALDWNTWEIKATGLFDQVPTGVGVVS